MTAPIALAAAFAVVSLVGVALWPAVRVRYWRDNCDCCEARQELRDELVSREIDV